MSGNRKHEFRNMFFGGDPFEQFAGHGMGGRGSQRGPVNNTEFYTVLGLEKDADEAAIKKAYRKLALKHHPDRGGNAEKFKEISLAYDVLCDPQKRKQYDQYGKDGIDESGGGAGHTPDDIFSMFFGGGGRGGPSGPRKGEDMQHPIKVTLEDLYNGKTCRLAINRNKLCPKCEGRGGKQGAEKNCASCHGQGVQVQYRQIGPGMVQKLQGTCPDCRGEGKVMLEKDKCKECNGNKVVKERKVLEVVISPGMKNNQKITFSGEADEAPGILPGNIHFIVQEKEHAVFKRKGADLIVEKRLTLTESLCGFDFTLTHMDGRVLRLTSTPGKVTKHDALQVVEGEGMPHAGNPYSKGRLFFLFKVVFPDRLSEEVIRTLTTVLPVRVPPVLTGQEEECHLNDIDPSMFGQDHTVGNRESYEDSDDEGRGGGQQRVQCQNM